MSSLVYLDVEMVMAIHRHSIETYGGSAGVLNSGAVHSAVSQASAAFFGQELHPTVAQKAAAYWFHLCQAHGFVDGNKRVAAASMLTFLAVNGLWLDATEAELESVTMLIAQGKMQKSHLARFIAGHLGN